MPIYMILILLKIFKEVLIKYPVVICISTYVADPLGSDRLWLRMQPHSNKFPLLADPLGSDRLWLRMQPDSNKFPLLADPLGSDRLEKSR